MKIIKNMKKVLAFVIAMILILSMNLTSQAAGSGTVNDPFTGSGDLEDDYDGSITIHKYDISAWETYINKDENRPAGAEDGYTITYHGNQAAGKRLEANDQVGYYYLTSADETAQTNPQVVRLGDLTAVSNITFRLQSAVPKEGKEGSTSPGDYTVTTGADSYDSYGKTVNGVMEWSGVAKGYYIITELANETTEGVIAPFVITVPMLDPADIASPVEIKDIHVYPKNKLKDGPEIEKEITSNLENGNIVSWKVTADVPADIGTSQRFIITDTMSRGLDYAGNLKVFYKTGPEADVHLVLTDDYTVNTETLGAGAGAGQEGKTRLKVTLTTNGRQKLGAAGVDKLYVTYDTIVNLTKDEWEELIQNAVENDIMLEFTNEDGTDYENKPGPIVVDDLSGVRITKKDGATGELLAGVTFKIYTRLNQAGDGVDLDSVLRDKAGNEIKMITDGDGIAYYYGLGEGTYYLAETETIGNYKLLTGYKTITITAYMAENNVAFELDILNYLDNGLSLPETGGMGTLLFTLAGILLIVAAAVVYLISRKKKKSIS